MSVVLGKRLRSDPGVRPVRQRTEVAGLSGSEDPLQRLSRLFDQVPRETLARALEVSQGDFETAVGRMRMVVEDCQEATEVVAKCATVASLNEAVEVVEYGMRRYHDLRKPPKAEDGAGRQVEVLLRDNTVLKKCVRFQHEKLQLMMPEVEENERIKKELEKERQMKETLLFHLHRCSV